MDDTVQTTDKSEVSTFDSVNAALGMGDNDELLSGNEATNQPADTESGVESSTEITTNESNGNGETDPDVTDKNTQAGDQPLGANEAHPKRNHENKAQTTPEDQDQLDENNWSKRTRQRFQDLTQRNSELTEIQRSYESLRGLINESVSSPDELVQVLDFTKALKTGDYQSALHQIDSIRNEIVLRSGIDQNAPDPLSAYPELREAVDRMEMGEKHALEIAQARRIQEQQKKQLQQQQHEQSYQQQYEQQQQQAVVAITELEKNWLATDPLAEQKLKQLQPQVEKIAQQYPPSQWVQILQTLYHTLNVSPPTTPRPLRANSGKVPKTEPQDTLGSINKALGF